MKEMKKDQEIEEQAEELLLTPETNGEFEEENVAVANERARENSRDASKVGQEKDTPNQESGQEEYTPADYENVSEVTTLSAHCGVQLGKQQGRQLIDEKKKVRNDMSAVPIPGVDNNSVQPESSINVNEEVVDDEETVLCCPMSSSVEPEPETSANDDTMTRPDNEEGPSIEEDTGAETPESVTVSSQDNTTTGAFSAYLAPDPREARQRMLDNAVMAISVRPYPVREREPPANKWKTPLVVVAVVVVVALAVSLGVTLRGRNKNQPTTSMSPTPAPTSARFGQAAVLVEDLFNTTAPFKDQSQVQAIQWIADVDTMFDDFDTVNHDQFRQRYALVLFYFSTGGPTSWIETSFFLKPGVHECEWWDTALPNTQSWSRYIGVYNCSAEQAVERIEINQNNMTGTLPPEIGSLSSLVRLAVLGNSIGGTLPPSLFGLSTLENVNGLSNEFTGTIPTEIGQASSLRFLWLRANSLTGTLPTEIGNVSGLNHLVLNINFLTGAIPETLALLSNLTFLDFAENALTGTLPSSRWSSWPNLEVFGVWDNLLSGTIPNNLDGLVHLEQLILAANSFTGSFPSSIVASTSVTNFDVADNELTGSLPNDWSNLSSTLTRLQVSGNRLTGTLPETLGNLSELEWLNVFDNRFNGTVPSSLGNLTKLEALGLGNSHLTGTVPTSFGQLTSLRVLTLHRSNLTGDLSFLCDGTEMLFPFLHRLFADCDGEIECHCCNYCCNKYDTCRDV